MSELKFYKYLIDNKIEVNEHGVMFIPSYIANEFCLFLQAMKDGGLECRMKENCFAFELEPICDYFGFNYEGLLKELLPTETLSDVQESKSEENNKLFYIQNGWVGNNVLWLSHNNGRTIEIDKALKFNREEIVKVLSRYGEYIAWDCGHVNSQENAHKHIIDGQYLDIDFRITQYQFQK